MKNTFRTGLAVLAVALVATTHSFALTAPVPEIDPSMATGSLVLLSGAILLIRGRRRRS